MKSWVAKVVILNLGASLAKVKTWVAKSPKKQKVANFKFHKAIKEGKNAFDRQNRQKSIKIEKMAIKCIFAFFNCLMKFENGDILLFLATKVFTFANPIQ